MLEVLVILWTIMELASIWVLISINAKLGCNDHDKQRYSDHTHRRPQKPINIEYRNEND